MIPEPATVRHQVAQLYLALTWTTPPPACDAIPRCDHCGVLPRPWAFVVLTWLELAGWLCETCLARAQAPPGSTIAPPALPR